MSVISNAKSTVMDWLSVISLEDEATREERRLLKEQKKLQQSTVNGGSEALDVKKYESYDDYTARTAGESYGGAKVSHFSEVKTGGKPSLRFYKLMGMDWGSVAKKAATDFKDGCTVMINCEEGNKDSVTRLTDFLGGTAFAHDGKIIRHGTYGYVMIPTNCDADGDIGGDIHEEFITNSFI